MAYDDEEDDRGAEPEEIEETELDEGTTDACLGCNHGKTLHRMDGQNGVTECHSFACRCEAYQEEI